MKDGRPLASYFRRMTTQTLPEDHSACNDADSLLEDCDCGENELAVAISKLESITDIHRNAAIHKKNLMSKFDTIRHLCVLRFLQKTQEDPRSRMTSSKQIAESTFGPEKERIIRLLYPDMEL